MDELRVAVVGCGRASESLHLPAITVSKHVRAELAVDADLPRAQRVAERYGIPRASAEFGDALGTVDAAVLALPHHLHAPVARALLEGGVHVLVEKPLALTVAQCDEVAAAAHASQRVLAVGMLRRWFPALRFARRVVHSGLLGRVDEFLWREGTIFRWPVASDFTFRRDAGGGVLTDLGVHALDALCWWFGEGEVRRYADDAMGGVEAECQMELAFENGSAGTVELGRTRDLPNRCVLHGERGRLEVGVAFGGEVRIELDGEAVAGPASSAGRQQGDVREAVLEQLEDFARAIRERRDPLAPGRESRRVVGLLEACRARREPLEHPWVRTAVEATP